MSAFAPHCSQRTKRIRDHYADKGSKTGGLRTAGNWRSEPRRERGNSRRDCRLSSASRPCSTDTSQTADQQDGGDGDDQRACIRHLTVPYSVTTSIDAFMKHRRIRTAHVHAAISLCALVSIASPGGAQAAQRNSARRPPAQPVLGARVAKLLEQDGLRFRDLNRNGRVDPYEDWRLTPDARARDLTGRMTLAEKAGAMMHGTIRSVGPMGRVGGGSRQSS